MKYGIQMYSLRTVAGQDLKKGLETVAKIGYKAVEFAGFFGNDAETVRSWLDELDLEVYSTHTGVKELTPETIEETIKYHKILGNKLIIIPGFSAKTREEFDAVIDTINYAQPILEKEGIKLAFHNHYKEFSLTDYGALIMQEFIEKTNINFQLDTYWTFYAGKDPLAVMDELKGMGRLVSIHLKDGLKDKTGRSLGQGEAPVEKVLDKAIEMGLPVVVESEGEDPTGPDEVGRCFEFLASLNK